jgi:hypothetical protein
LSDHVGVGGCNRSNAIHRLHARENQLQACASYNIDHTGVFRHVQWILKPHVNDRCANLDPLRLRTDSHTIASVSAGLLGRSSGEHFI